MRNKRMIRLFRGLVLTLFIVAFTAGTAAAAEYWLWAGQTNMTMPDATMVPVWGYCLDANSDLTSNTTVPDCTPTVPGPRIAVPDTDTTLTIHLGNALLEPTSLHILGQQLTSPGTGPVWTSFYPTDTVTSFGSRNAGDYTSRIRSFTPETTPGGTTTYVWGPPFNVGTYMYQSGTNPAKQVQMGLYGAVTKDSAPGVAYPDNPNTPAADSIAYDQEVVVIFHEIDPAIHNAIATNDYGVGKTIKSSVYREPKYFLMNGMGWPNGGLDPIHTTPINAGDSVLIRFLNAGLDQHVPQIYGMYMRLVAEDGNLYNYQKLQYGFELSAGQTVDAYFTAAQGRYPLYDGMTNRTNAGVSPGGMLAYLNVDLDAVSITQNKYKAGQDRLLVIATTDATPGTVTLYAEGYGLLPFDAGNGDYRRWFTGVTTKPDSVTVTSTAGGSDTKPVPFPTDIVTITKAVHKADDSLVIIATSDAAPGSVNLLAEGFGYLIYKAASMDYRRTFPGIVTPPASVTVTSSGGGSDTQTVPFP